MDNNNNKIEAIVKFIIIGLATVLGGFLFYWAFTFIYHVIRIALEG